MFNWYMSFALQVWTLLYLLISVPYDSSCYCETGIRATYNLHLSHIFTHIYVYILWYEYIWQSSLQQSGWRKDGYKSPFVEFFQNSFSDEALEPSPSFELFQERSMFLFDLKKKPWPLTQQPLPRVRCDDYTTDLEKHALVSQEFPHCFCCFCRCAFRLPFKKSAQQCWACLPQIEATVLPMVSEGCVSPILVNTTGEF